LNKHDIIDHAEAMQVKVRGEWADIIEAMLLGMLAKIEEKKKNKERFSWIASISAFFWRRLSCTEKANSAKPTPNGWIVTDKSNLIITVPQEITDFYEEESSEQSPPTLGAKDFETAHKIEDDTSNIIQFEVL
jgi:hypothetical protein